MRIIVGISGASGAIIGVRILHALRQQSDCEIHLVLTKGAEQTIKQEVEYTLDQITGLADVVHSNGDLGASIASGSYKTAGMIIAPCSMKTLAGVVSGYSDNLLLRAADVCLKERRPLVMLPRETPLSSIHLENMLKASRNGCIILPPMMGFYNKPKTIDDMIDHIVGKTLAIFGIEHKSFKPWFGG